MDNETLYKKLCSIEELLQMVFRTQEWNAIGDSHPDEKQWVIVVDHVHEQAVEAQYTGGKFYYGDYLTFVMPDDYCGYWLPMQRSKQTHRTPDINPVEYTFIDKSKWPDGPWKTEPDRAIWTDNTTGLTCMADREERNGFLCGYVGVDDKHVLYGKNFNELGLKKVDFCGSLVDFVDFQDGLQDVLLLHWFGFCCANRSDLIPNNPNQIKNLVIYKDVEYVKSECRRLAAQLGAIK